MNELENTVFYKIIKGEMPSFKIHEDRDFLVILDRFPCQSEKYGGHCLILPKIPAKDIFDLNESSAAGLYPLAKKISIAIKKATGCEGINIIQNNGPSSGQAVFYFHLHIVPRFKNDDVEIKTIQHNVDEKYLDDLSRKIKGELDV